MTEEDQPEEQEEITPQGTQAHESVFINLRNMVAVQLSSSNVNIDTLIEKAVILVDGYTKSIKGNKKPEYLG